MNQVLFAIVLIFLDARKSRLEFGRLDTVPVKVVRLILQLCQQPSFPHLHPPCSLPEVVEKEGKGEGNRDTDHLQLCYIFFSFLPPAFLFFYYLWKSCPLPLYLPQPPLSWSPPGPETFRVSLSLPWPRSVHIPHFTGHPRAGAKVLSCRCSSQVGRVGAISYSLWALSLSAAFFCLFVFLKAELSLALHSCPCHLLTDRNAFLSGREWHSSQPSGKYWKPSGWMPQPLGVCTEFANVICLGAFSQQEKKKKRLKP